MMYIHQTHQQKIRKPANVAGYQADRSANAHGNRNSAKRHGYGLAGAIDQAFPARRKGRRARTMGMMATAVSEAATTPVVLPN